MKTEETLGKPGGELTDTALPTKVGGGFVAGLLLGIMLGAGVALLFAPDQGERTRGRLRKRIRSIKDDAREGIDRAGSRTRKELLRRQRRLRAELERVRERAREALD
jgi:gas vesicle protein